MKDIRLVALDLDGTVFNDKKEITPRTLAAIRAACARGVAVLPATGRTASGIPAAFTSIPGVRYALTSNGASVVDLTTGEQLVNQPFGTEQALKIYDLLEQGGGMMSIFIGGKSYTTRENAESHMDVVPENLKSYFRTTRIEVDDMHARCAPTRTKSKSTACSTTTRPSATLPGVPSRPPAPAWSWRPACPATWRSTPPA